MTKLVFVYIAAIISTNLAFPSSIEKSNLALQLVPSDAKIFQPSKNYVKRSTLDNEITGKTVVDHMQKGLGISKKLMGKVLKFLLDIDKLEADIDQKIIDVTKEIGVVAAQHLKYMKLARGSFQNAKLSLHRTRRVLLALAEDTIESTKEIQFFMEGWGQEYGEEERKAFLLEQLTILENLIERTHTELGNAKIKYQEAESQLLDVNKHLDDFVDDLKKLRDEESAEFKALTAKIRNAAIGVTVSMVLLDVFGCLGVCSAINAIGWLADPRLEDAKATINELYETISSANKDVKDAKDNTGKLLHFIEVELTLISSWETHAKHMESKLKMKKQFEQSSTKQYFDLNFLKKSFQDDLLDLQKAASDFINRKVHQRNQ